VGASRCSITTPFSGLQCCGNADLCSKNPHKKKKKLVINAGYLSVKLYEIFFIPEGTTILSPSAAAA